MASNNPSGRPSGDIASALLVNVDNDTLRRVLENPEAMAAVERIEAGARWATTASVRDAVLNGPIQRGTISAGCRR